MKLCYPTIRATVRGFISKSRKIFELFIFDLAFISLNESGDFTDKSLRHRNTVYHIYGRVQESVNGAKRKTRGERSNSQKIRSRKVGRDNRERTPKHRGCCTRGWPQEADSVWTSISTTTGCKKCIEIYPPRCSRR